MRAAFRKAIDYQIENGVDGVCIFGSTGGNGSFTDDEMKKATAIAAKHIDGRISLVAGTGARTTTACISLSKHAEDVGCDGVMVLPVSYWPLSTDEVFDTTSASRSRSKSRSVSTTIRGQPALT